MTSKLARASFWAMAGSGLQYLILFVLLAYLTRILQPRDFGLMATLSIGLDLGLRVARWGQIELLQHPLNRTDAARNHAFRLSNIIAGIMTVLFLTAAWPMGQYFSSPELALMAYLCAPVILLSAAGSTAEAILRNEFRFQQIAYRNMASTLIGGVVALALAVQGHGAVALAAQQLVQAAISCLWSWAVVEWRPMLRRAARPPYIMRHGASIMIGSLLPQLIPRAFDLFVGLLLGPVALGIMRVANRFNDFIGQMFFIALVGVASAQFSNVSDDMRALRMSYLQIAQASATIVCPVMIGVGLVAAEAVPLLFGASWHASIPIVQISSMLAFVLPVSAYFVPAMIARGRRQAVVRQSIADVVTGLILAIAAASISLEAVAIAVVMRFAYTSACNARDLRRALKLSLRRQGRNLAPAYTATLIMIVSVTGARGALDASHPPLLILLVLTAVGAVSYVGTLALGAHLRLWPSHGAAIARLLSRTVPSS